MESGWLAEVKAAVELSMKGDPESVAKATTLLSETLPARKGYLPALLAVTVDNTIDLGTRKAAAIILGKEIKLNWRYISSETRQYPEEDKAIVKQEFMEALVRCNDQSIIKLLGHALHSILVRESSSWPQIEDIIYNTLTQSPTHERIYCSLVALHALCKVRQYYVDEDRAPIIVTTQRFFPTLLELATTLKKDLNPVNALLLKEITKVYFRSIRIDLNDYLRNIQVNDGWMDLFFELFAMCVQHLSSMHLSKVDDTTYFSSSYWNILKWITRIIKRYTFRYGDVDKETTKYQDFAAHWMNKYSGAYWDRIVEVVNNRKVIRIPDPIIVVCLSILFNLFDNDIVMAKDQAILDSVILDTMIDVMKFTKEEEALFYDNPVEYFRKNDENNTNFGPAGQALNVFGKAFKRKKYLKLFMKFVNQSLTSKLNPRNQQPIGVIDIEAYFHIIENHSIAISRIKDCSSVISGLLQNYVMPELASEHGFMRMRACKMVSSYASSLLGADMLKNLSDGVVKCLADKDLPVRSCAAQAFETLLKKKELRDYFLPNLKELLGVYVKLINEFENDTLIASLKGIFEMYSDVIGPYAIDLTKNLADLFFKCLEKEKRAQEAEDDTSENEKEVMESGFACQGCIVAIEEILRSSVDPSILPQIYEIVEPMLAYGFSGEGLDFLSEISGILNMLIYNLDPLPNAIWGYYVIICYAMIGKPADKAPNFPDYVTPKLKEIYNDMPNDDYAAEFSGELSVVLRNFAHRGDPFLFQGVDFYGLPLLELTIKVIIASLQKNLPHEYSQVEVADMLLMPGYILAQQPAKLNSWIGRLLEISKDALSTKFIQIVKDCFVHNLGYSLWNNTLLTLESLNSLGMFSNVMKMWPEHHRRAAGYRVRKGSFIGFMSLFSLTTEQLHQAGIPIIDIYKLMVADLPRLAREQERAINAEFEDSDDEDDMDDDSDELVDVNLDDDAEEKEAPKENAKKNQKMDSIIQKTQKKIDDLREDEKLEIDEAKAAFEELDSRIFNDAADKINEILVFETTLSNLQTSNPILFKEIEAATTPEMKAIFMETSTKVKKLIDDK